MAPIKVRMRIFSGVKDPEWVVEDGGVQQEIRERIKQLESRSAEIKKEKKKALLPGSALPDTGYRGFDVTIDGKTHRVFSDELVAMMKSSYEPTEKEAQKSCDRLLFDTQANQLMEQYGLRADAIQASTTRHPIAGLPAATCDTSPLEIGHATYRPSLWTPDPFCDNTCYGYAANVQTEDPVYPDDKKNRLMWTRDQLIDALRADGFGNPILQLPNSSTSTNGGHFLVALLDLRGTDKGDFHFMRLDHSGCWSHKVSTLPVTQRDEQTPKKKLTDLCAARFNAEFTFVGFFVTTEAAQNLLDHRGNP